ncbi:hypothetical protein SKAU_G00154850 [Synaphobranchus kaupii]|uniref:Uncharacterized protein n=1 Tax=Synaphobranchus kaupii TaxID=118154 RepID=A0A9Q1FHD8_SYNKA|nr:hypothetical protein SKAU_G00154850 [Synaphobranchus kaupii]
MASAETPPLSIRHGIRIVPPEPNVTVEEVLLAVALAVECGDVGHKRFACPHRQQAEAGSADVNTPPGASGSEAGERSATPGDKETAAQPEASDPGAENAETPIAEQAVASSSAGAETVIRGEGTSTEPTEEITGSAQEIPSNQVAGTGIPVPAWAEQSREDG